MLRRKLTKILVLMLSLALLISSMPAGGVMALDETTPPNYAFESKFIAGEVTVDGVIDETAWDISHELTQRAATDTADATNRAAKFDTLWDMNKLYVAFDVTDSNLVNKGNNAEPYLDDSVEVYIDGKNAKAGYDAINWHYVDNNTAQYLFRWYDASSTYNTSAGNIFKFGNEGAITSGIEYSVQTKEGNTGYIVEIAIPWACLRGMSVEPGDIVGITAHLNDGDEIDTVLTNDYLGYTPGYDSDWQNDANWAAMALSPVVFNDDCTNLASSGWTLDGAAKVGGYITDNARTTGELVDGMKPVDAGQYLLYGDATGGGANEAIYRFCNIGTGAWELELNAKFADLMTTIDGYEIYRGMLLNVYAGGKGYLFIMNSQNKIHARTDANSGFATREVSMPTDTLFHKWTITYDGISKVIVSIDGVQVASFEGLGFAAPDVPDMIKIHNVSLNLVSGVNEVYFENIKMSIPKITVVAPSDLIFEDDCSSLAAAGWVVDTGSPGVYITDAANTIGNPDTVTMKPVTAGQYLIYGDEEGFNSKTHKVMSRDVSIGTGPWELQYDAKIVDVMIPSLYPAYRGFIIRIFAGGKSYLISYNGGSKLLGMTDAGSGAAQEVIVTMPTDDLFHKWAIAYDGTNKVMVSIDEVKVATFENIGLTDASSDKIMILNAPYNWVSGANEIYLDNIKMIKTDTQAIQYDPRLAGCSILPSSSSASVDVIANTALVNPVWFIDPAAQVVGTLYKDGQEIATQSTQLTDESVSMSFDPAGNTGELKLVLKLMKGSVKVNEIVRNIDLDTSVTALNPGDNVTAEAGKVYLFDRIEQMTGPDGRDLPSSGWFASTYKYDGSDLGGTFLESMGAAQQITLPATLNGWYGVYVGYVTGTEEFIAGDGTSQKDVSLQVKLNDTLNDEPEFKSSYTYGSKGMCEVFAIASDFNGGTVSITPIEGKLARIAYIKLKVLTAEEIALYNKPDEGAAGKRVTYNNDGFSDFYSGYYYSEASLKANTVDGYENQDVGAIDWCMGTTTFINFDSEFAGYPYYDSEQYEDQMRDGDKQARTDLQRFADAGRYPQQIIAARAHEIGIKANISLRMDSFYDPAVYGFLNGSIYNDFLDCRTVNKDGTLSNDLSYAYPKFREYVKNILVEAAITTSDVDGVNLDFCRYPYSLFGYEPILIDAYKAEFGADVADPRTDTTVDGIARWNQFKADIMTAFIRELRAALPGKTLSVRIPYKGFTETDLPYDGYFEYGLDIQKWVDEGLIDVLIPSCISYEEFYDVTPFAEMVEGTDVMLVGGINADLTGHDLTKEEEDLIKRGVELNLSSSSLSVQQYRLRAYELYSKGCEGLYIFNDWHGRNSMGLLGDKVKVEKWYGLAYTSEWVQNMISVTAPVSEYAGSIEISGKALSSFNYLTDDYTVTLPYGTTSVPGISVTTLDPGAKAVISNARTLADATTVAITSSDGQRTKTYTLHFQVAAQNEALIIGTPVFTNLAGQPVDSLGANTLVRAEVTIRSNTFTTMPATMIIALYDAQGAMMDLAYVSKSIAANEEVSFSTGLTMPSVTDGYYIKVFVWDNIANQQAYSGWTCFPVQQ